MSPTRRRTISPNTVLLFELGWDILLYESLRLENILKTSVFSAELSRKMMKIWKNSNFSIFSILCENFFEFSTSVKSKSFRCLFNQILFFIFCTYNAAAYAFGVRHVAPSPPGARNEPRGGDAPRHRHWIPRCFFLKALLQVSAYTSLPIHITSLTRLNIDAQNPLSNEKMHFRQIFNFITFFTSDVKPWCQVLTLI